MQILDDIKYGFDDLAICPCRSEAASRKDVSLIREFKLRSGATISGFPFIAANLDTTGVFEVAKELKEFKAFTCLHKFYPIEELYRWWSSESWVNEYCFYTIGLRQEEYIKLKEFCNICGYVPKLLAIDVPNGYSHFFSEYVRKIKDEFNPQCLMVGNVVTSSMAQELVIGGGADIIKIGISNGSLCKTYFQTGVFYPQLSACIESANAVHGLKAHICSDGGCKSFGDVAKALCAGADLVMGAGLINGSEECQGEWTYKSEIIWKDKNHPMLGQATYTGREIKDKLKSYGMSSTEAMEKYYGKVDNYRTSEGDCQLIEYKGPVKNIIQNMMGALRSTGAYIGASSLKDFSKCCTFIKIH